MYTGADGIIGENVTSKELGVKNTIHGYKMIYFWNINDKYKYKCTSQGFLDYHSSRDPFFQKFYTVLYICKIASFNCTIYGNDGERGSKGGDGGAPGKGGKAGFIQVIGLSETPKINLSLKNGIEFTITTQ